MVLGGGYVITRIGHKMLKLSAGNWDSVLQVYRPVIYCCCFRGRSLFIGATYRTYGYYGWPNSSIPIWLDGMDCVGTESTLLSCPLSRAIGSVRCSYNAIAGVVCPGT